jgi:hypothetical protein
MRIFTTLRRIFMRDDPHDAWALHTESSLAARKEARARRAAAARAGAATKIHKAAARDRLLMEKSHG